MASLGAVGEISVRDVLKGLIGLVLFGGTALVILYDWLSIGGPGLDFAINGPLYDAVIVSAGLACLLQARTRSGERAAWLLIAVAIFAWGAAEIYWTAVLDVDPSPPVPSPADVGYLAFYPLAAGGVWLLVRAHARELDWRLWIDALISAMGTAALGAAIVFEYVADRTTGSDLEVATALAYPLADILLLAFAVGVVALTGWRPGRTWSLLLLGLASLAAADIAFTLQSDGALPGGDWVEPIYLLGAVFLGAEAWQGRLPRIQAVGRFDGWRELMVPGVVSLLMIALFTIQFSSSSSALPTVLTAATMLTVVARLATTARENQRLLELVRTDQLTGLGNSGKLQLDLSGQCDRAAVEPSLLILLDLNGFKRFNDTFGHPAGDSILQTLGQRLRDAVGECGGAYRIGGDEFAVLITCEEEAHDAVAKRAAAALCTKGKGFELGAAWGSVAIPAEASKAAAAMQLADARMYAQKEARRRARGEPFEPAPTETAMRLRRVSDSEALEQHN